MVLGMTVGASAQTAQDKEPTATISGKVTLEGDAVQGVVVTLRSNEPKTYRQLLSQRGVTDSKGEYVIANVPPGNYTVVAAGGAFVAGEGLAGERTVIVNKAEMIQNFDFSLVTGGVITGKVTDAEGRPIIEEEIHIFSGREARLFSPYPAAITDDRGVYRIFGLKPGSYKVAAGREGDPGTSTGAPGPHLRTFYPAAIDSAQATAVQVTERSEATEIDITFSRLSSAYTVSGRIVDGNTGTPLANVNYGFKRSSDSIGGRNFGATSNERGEFKLENMPPGQYAIVVAQRPGSYFRADDLPFVITDHDVTGLVVKTIQDGSVSGVLVLDGGPNNERREQLFKTNLFASVANEETRRTGMLGIQAEVNPNGSFRIGGLPAGTATFSLDGVSRFIVIRVEQNGIILRGVEVKPGEDITGIRIVAAYEDASLSGAVELVNGPMPVGARLDVTAFRISGVPSRTGSAAKVDPRGNFVFDSLLPGTYEVHALVFLPGARGPLVQTKQEVVVISGSTTNITIRLDLKPPRPNQ